MDVCETLCRSDLQIAHPHRAARKFAVILRNGEQQIGKGRRISAFSPSQALVFRRVSTTTAGLPCLVTVCGSRRAALTTSLKRFFASCNDQLCPSIRHDLSSYNFWPEMHNQRAFVKSVMLAEHADPLR